MHTGQIEFDNITQQATVFGAFDANIRAIEQQFGVSVSLRDSQVEVCGDAPEGVEMAMECLDTLKRMYDIGEELDSSAVGRAVEMVRSGDVEDSLRAMSDIVIVTHKGQPIKCKTIGQKAYVKALRENTVTLCIGPAGTGKTYLAVAVAISALRRKEIDRIIMSRPAVEAGEKLGFLPGDLQNKVDPYLRPLYDAFNAIVGPEVTQRYLEKGIIEIAPLAFMRGRTLDNACVIIDEAQNATLDTLKMVLTRFGEGAKVILTGDVTQIDLPREAASGLEKCAELLKGIEGIAVARLSNRDVVRHKLVKEIVKAFEKYEQRAHLAPGQPARRGNGQRPQG
nr:PhoH family protein [bacterium]